MLNNENRKKYDDEKKNEIRLLLFALKPSSSSRNNNNDNRVRRLRIAFNSYIECVNVYVRACVYLYLCKRVFRSKSIQKWVLFETA